MRNRSSRTTLIVVALVVVAAVAGGVAQRGSAAQTAPSKHFSAALSPHSVVRGATVAATFTLKNTSAAKSGYQLGSADVTIPDGYDVTGASVSSPNGWRATVGEGVIQLRADGVEEGPQNTLGPGDAVKVALTVVVSCAADTGTWSTVAGSSTGSPQGDFTSDQTPTLRATGRCSFAFNVPSPQTAGNDIYARVQALDGNGNLMTAFNGTATVSGNLDNSPNGTAPSYNSELSFYGGVADNEEQSLATPYDAEGGRVLQVTSGAISGRSNGFDVQPSYASGLAFGQQPTDVQKNTAISPAITVDVLDPWGNLETGANQASVRLFINNDANPETSLGGTTTQTSVAGVATFGDITLDHSGNGFTLGAQFGFSEDAPVLNAAAVTEEGFVSNPFDVFDAICTSSCTATNPDGNTTVSLSDGHGTTIQFGPSGQVFTCNDFTAPSRGSIVTIVPGPGFTAGDPLTATFTYDASVLGESIDNALTSVDNQSPFTLCISKDGGATYTSVGSCPTSGSGHDDDGDDNNGDDHDGNGNGGDSHDGNDHNGDGHTDNGQQHNQDSNVPCISSQSFDQNGNLVVVLQLTSTDPGVALG